MPKFSFARNFGVLLAVLVFVWPVAARTDSSRSDAGRLPVIVIPGLTGSELVNKNTGDKVWFSLSRAKDDDLRLPVTPDLKSNRDDLVPGDILRKIQIIRFTPEIEIYQKLIESLEKDGYSEGKIDEPPETGDADTFYIFSYDWRLDNVENSHILLEKMDRIRAKLKRPDLRFNVIAHSMGGLIARYAAMYGRADLSTGKMRPVWKGSSYFKSISMIGTPNGGSISALSSLIHGFSLFGVGRINIPFIRNLSKFDLFTIPSIYQLLPHDGQIRAFDENLKPVKIDIYDPANWEEFSWTAYSDRKFGDEFNVAGQKNARAYFRAVLLRAKLFQAALSVEPGRKNAVPIYYLGAECKPTLDGVVIYKDRQTKLWKTIFDLEEFTKLSAGKFTKAEIEKIFYSPGDGVVSRSSLTAHRPKEGQTTIVCGDHNRLAGQAEIDESLRGILNLPEQEPDEKNPNKAVKAKDFN